MLRATLGAALLGVVVADSIHAVRTGALPVYRLSVPWGLAMAGLLAILALRPARASARAACLLGLVFVFFATALPSDMVVHHKIQGAAITQLFAIGGVLVAEEERRHFTTHMVGAAVVAALLRGMMFGS